jgi:hypothetical protein
LNKKEYISQPTPVSRVTVDTGSDSTSGLVVNTKYTVGEINHLRRCIQKYDMNTTKQSFVAMMEKERGENEKEVKAHHKE